jgi:hypothetical protein
LPAAYDELPPAIHRSPTGRDESPLTIHGSPTGRHESARSIHEAEGCELPDQVGPADLAALDTRTPRIRFTDLDPCPHCPGWTCNVPFALLYVTRSPL